MTKYILAIDLGASSGRHIVGKIANDKIEMEEVYRFPNSVIKSENGLIWDIDKIYQEVVAGIQIALNKFPTIESLSIDSWAVDYVLLDNKNEIIYPVYAYRNDRTLSVIDDVHKLISFEKLYKITGIQYQSFNSIYQLYYDKVHHRLDNANDFLMIPEYLIYKLTGVKVKEYTNASSTSLLDLATKDYSEEILSTLGFNKKLFTKLHKPGFIVGKLHNEVFNTNVDVKLCASHDTASAVHTIKMDHNCPYISSGTWSLLGIKDANGINSERARLCNYSNEYGPNYIRVQKNIMGHWIMQRIAKEYNVAYVEMLQQARNSKFKLIYDVNDPCFLAPDNMCAAIKKWFQEHNMKVPQTQDDYVMCTCHSLAYSYKVAIEELENITKQKFDTLYIVGGGAKNTLLNELTAQYTKCKIIASSVEASALGNIMTQMMEESI